MNEEEEEIEVTIADRLNYLIETKRLIREAIIARGVEVPEDTPFREYANKISQISSITGPTITGPTMEEEEGEW